MLVGHISKATNGMWEMNMQPMNNTPKTYRVNAIMKLPGVADKVNFYIACMFSPTIETLCTAIDAGHLQSFPGHLTSAQVRKHGIRSAAMLAGHQDQIRKGLNSTKTIQTNIETNPEQEENKHEMYCAMHV